MLADGSAIAHVDHQTRLCEVCGTPLSIGGSWFVTLHPKGVHTSCRDWTNHPFPFLRHMDELAKIGRKNETSPRAKDLCIRATRALAAHRRTWPGGGGASVEACLKITSAVKGALRQAGVEAKPLSRF